MDCDRGPLVLGIGVGDALTVSQSDDQIELVCARYRAASIASIAACADSWACSTVTLAGTRLFPRADSARVRAGRPWGQERDRQ